MRSFLSRYAIYISARYCCELLLHSEGHPITSAAVLFGAGLGIAFCKWITAGRLPRWLRAKLEAGAALLNFKITDVLR